jgi:hypothetical protein
VDWELFGVGIFIKIPYLALESRVMCSFHPWSWSVVDQRKGLVSEKKILQVKIPPPPRSMRHRRRAARWRQEHCTCYYKKSSLATTICWQST